jgi:cation diffusion facilitator CzcD-associated flavoprotein CzcO
MARSVSVAIVGAGFGGVAAAARLKQQGRDDFVVLERGERIGGVWRANTYPGIACDVPSHLYSFSFAPNPAWSRRFSPGSEIQAYLDGVAERFGLKPHMRFGQDVTRASFDEETGRWRLAVANGEDVEADVLITACGQLTRASIPALPGLDRFRGPMFHSAHWDPDFDPSGKRVAVVGTGASAIQFVPRIAEQVAHMTIFQRSAPWVLGKMDRLYPERVRRLHERRPFLTRMWRKGWWLWFESLVPVFTRPAAPAGRITKALYKLLADANRFAQLRGDRELWRKTTPDYPVGCKRILITAEWYPTLRRPNVDLETGGITEVTEDCVVTADGRSVPVDAIVFGTGFTATEFLAPMEVFGRGGRRLADAWARGAEAYLGITVPDFPNLFCLYGPNTNIVINGSIIYFSELEVRYILESIRLLLDGGHRALDCRHDVHDGFNKRIDDANRSMAWGASKVNSWYKNANGRVAQNWPFSLLEYWQQTRRVDAADYELL